MRLSVIIPSYNSRRTIERCLASVQAQRTSAPFEVIVVDSSSDGTAELIRRTAPGVSLYCLEGRRYPGDARNLGLARSRGEIIASPTRTACWHRIGSTGSSKRTTAIRKRPSSAG